MVVLTLHCNLRKPSLNQLVCIDRDAIAIQTATERLCSYGNRVQIHRGAFADILETIEPDTYAGILMD